MNDCYDYFTNEYIFPKAEKVELKNPSANTTTTNTYHSSKVNYSNSYIDEKKDIDIQIKKIWERLNKTIALVHNCQNCGAKLEVEENHPIFHCKYCGSTYIIGSVQPNSRY